MCLIVFRPCKKPQLVATLKKLIIHHLLYTLYEIKTDIGMFLILNEFVIWSDNIYRKQEIQAKK